MTKGTIFQKKWQPTDGNRFLFTNFTTDRKQISKICKELRKVDIKKPNNPTKIGIEI